MTKMIVDIVILLVVAASAFIGGFQYAMGHTPVRGECQVGDVLLRNGQYYACVTGSWSLK